jgi:hypothetical protein
MKQGRLTVEAVENTVAAMRCASVSAEGYTESVREPANAVAYRAASDVAPDDAELSCMADVRNRMLTLSVIRDRCRGTNTMELSSTDLLSVGRWLSERVRSEDASGPGLCPETLGQEEAEFLIDFGRFCWKRGLLRVAMLAFEVTRRDDLRDAVRDVLRTQGYRHI